MTYENNTFYRIEAFPEVSPFELGTFDQTNDQINPGIRYKTLKYLYCQKK